MTANAGTDDAYPGPYVGTRAFSARESQWFPGRSRESAELARLWDSSQVTVLSGPSGVGKTSLLAAGVIPLLQPSRADVLPVGWVSRGTAFPVAALPDHNPHTLALLTKWAPGEAETRLVGLSVLDFLRRRPVRADPQGRRLLVFAAIDQLEDLFSGPGYAEPHRAPFVDELVEALREMPQLRLLLSVRDDYLDDLRRYGALSAFPDMAEFRLRPLARDDAVRTLSSPVAGAGCRFTADAADSIVASVSTAEGDVDTSMLQVVSSALRAGLSDGVREVTGQHLAAAGGVGRILSRFYEQAVAAIAVAQGIPLTELRTWLARTFVTELNTRDTCYEGVTRTAGMPNAVVRALRDWCILTASKRAGARWYELHHDSLIGPVRRGGLGYPDEPPSASTLSPADYVRAAELAMADGDLALSERHAAQALRSAERTDLRSCAEAESLLGNVEHLRGRPCEAEDHYLSAAVLYETLQDTSAVARLLAAIGRMLLVQGRYGEAISQLNAAVERVPGDPAVQTELAWALWHAGQQRAAIDVLTGVLAVDGDASVALRARGEILADLGDAEGALRDLDRVQRHPQPSTKAARGLALATLRRLSAADPEIHAALSSAPDSGPVLLYAARAAALAKDPAIAADLARRAMSATDPAVPPHQRREAERILEAVG